MDSNNNEMLENVLSTGCRSFAELATTPWWTKTAVNPAVRFVQETVLRYREEAIRRAEFALTESIGRLSEHEDVYAHLSSIYVCLGKRLHPVALHNHGYEMIEDVEFGENCMVARVAEEQRTRYAPDVRREERYWEISPSTKSELTVPIIWEGELLGVINLESRVIDGLKSASAAVEAAIPSMVADLLVLKACYAEDESFFPWHPETHGWDLADQLSQLLQGIAKALSGAAPKLSIWYPDWEKDQLYAYATFGFDWVYVDGQSLRLGQSQIGKALSSLPGSLEKLDISKFIRADKAVEMGIDEAWVMPIYQEGNDAVRPHAAITCYFSNNGRELDAVDENDRELAKEAMLGLSKLLTKMFAAYNKQRARVAAAVVSAVNDRCRLEPQRTRFEEWLNILNTILNHNCKVGSVFQLSGLDNLRCIASTGFYNDENWETRSVKLESHRYDFSTNDSSHTKVAFSLKGKALRRLDVGNSQEKGLPNGCPEIGNGMKNAEFVFGQNASNCSRQLLACAYAYKDRNIGVLRLVRGKKTRPFTSCDASLMETICAKYAPIPNARDLSWKDSGTVSDSATAHLA